MTTEELKQSALRNLLEEYLWKYGEADTFTLGGPNGTIDYRLERTIDGWELRHKLSRADNWIVDTFPTMGRAYAHIFHGLNIAY